MKNWYTDEIEDSVKELNIDRNRFRYLKQDYEKIIRKFYYSFSDYKNFTPSKINLSYNFMHLRDNLESSFIDCFFFTYDWVKYLDNIKKSVPQTNEKMYLILEYGCVYEGYTDEIFAVMSEGSCNYDFYIVSPEFDWFIAVSDMEDNATLYKNKEKNNVSEKK